MSVKSHVTASRLVMLSALAALAGSGAVLAEPPKETFSRTVSFADLDLTTSAGAATLYGRIENAARIVCGPMPTAVDVASSQDWQACYRGAISGAVRQVDQPTLTALHGSKTGRKPPRLASR